MNNRENNPFANGFLVGVMLMALVWFARDGQRQRQVVREPASYAIGMDRRSFDLGATAGLVVLQKTQDVTVTNFGLHLQAAWHEWTNSPQTKTNQMILINGIPPNP